MKCPRCTARTQVLQIRAEQRRRECTGCGHRFSTVEVRTTARDPRIAARLRSARRTLRSARRTLRQLGYLQEVDDARA